MRAIVLVMDSVGIGGAPDAEAYGDLGANTLLHIAEACRRGAADNALREGPLRLPHLASLGLGDAHRAANGAAPPEFESRQPIGRGGSAAEISKGKDTPSGHWELAGVPVSFDWGYFPKAMPCFPQPLIDQLCARAELPGILGNCHASGTDIIAQHGDEHIRSGKPICYTSADSVFQIAAHEQEFGLERLYAACEIARELVDGYNIGRVIARPYVGYGSDATRTANRRDYAVPPPGRTMLDAAAGAGREIVTIGKIADIFAHRSTGSVLKGDDNDAQFEAMLQGLERLGDGGLLFANFIDFDTLYGHRRDIAGYALALEAFDRRLPELFAQLKPDDLLVITADHGCDPTWPGSDHTREQVPVLVLNGNDGASRLNDIGARWSFSDVGASIVKHLQLPPLQYGSEF